MTHFPEWRARARASGRHIVLLGALLGVSACTDTGEFMFGSRDAAAAGPAPIGATPQSERDVEAPEVFEIATEGLWDGRPSLGGVWVAHPDATDPERVMIRNEDNGRFVIGALFRRERDNPGPSVQISSDAAAALDILAGAPANVRVTALRREATPEAGADMPIADAAPQDGEDDADAGMEIAAIAAAAIPPEPDEAAAVATSAPGPRPLARLLDPPAAPVAAVLPRNMSAEDVMAGITRAAFSPEGLAPAGPQPPVASVAEAPVPQAEITSAAIAPVEIAPLSPPAPEPVAAAAPAETSAAAPARPAPSAQLPDRAFVQIGIFAVQENADNTGQTLRNAGLVPTIYDQTSNGRQFWRVVVGPAPTTEDRAAVLDTVRGLGFEDAYFVAR